MSRWILVIPEKTNRMVHRHLALRGSKKGDLSEFVDRAVRQALFHETVDAMKDRNADTSSDLIEEAINEAVDWARETRA